MSTLEDLAATFIGPLEATKGPVLSAYQDEAGVWTIGFGTTYYLGVAGETRVTEGLVWTAEQCMSALANDITATVAAVVAANAWHPWNDNEIVALTSLAYNIGLSAFRSSTVLREPNAGNKAAAAAAFALWDKAHVDGQLVTVDGLLARREAEAAKYLS